MVVDNYGNLIEEPFHGNTWCIEQKYDYRGGAWEYSWQHYKSYKSPLDVQKALKDLRKTAKEWNKEFDLKISYRPARRVYRKVETGFHAKHLDGATSNVWWRPNQKIRNSIRSLESKKVSI